VRGGAGDEGPMWSARRDEGAWLVPTLPPPPAMAVPVPAPVGVPVAAPVPLQTMPWARPRSSIPWMRLVVGLMLLVVLGYVFIKWGLSFISEKVMIFFYPLCSN
jgi:hypothetical protein